MIVVLQKGLEWIGEWKQLIGDKPIVTISGRNVARESAVYKAGAGSVCVVADKLQSAAGEQRMAAWLRGNG